MFVCAVYFADLFSYADILYKYLLNIMFGFLLQIPVVVRYKSQLTGFVSENVIKLILHSRPDGIHVNTNAHLTHVRTFRNFLLGRPP